MGIGRTEYSFAELDHPVTKSSRVNAKGEAWRSRIELWVEDVQKYLPIPDPKVRAAIEKQMSGLGAYYQIQIHRTMKDGRAFSFKKLAAGTREDPVIMVD